MVKAQLIAAFAFFVGTFSLTVPEAGAQALRSEPVRIIVAYPAGGTSDSMVRILADPLAKLLGRPVVVINRPGAAGAIGTLEVARAAPDGHTLLYSNNGPHSILPLIRSDLGYEAVKSFAPVSLVGTAPFVMIVHPALPVSSVKDVIEYARANPGKLDFASSGIGAIAHLAGELFARTAGVKMFHIPYKGQVEQVNAVIAGDVKMAITSPSATINANVAARKLKLLGVSSNGPSPFFPGVPAISETLPAYVPGFWFGLLAPQATPPAIIDTLNKAVSKALADPALIKRYFDLGILAKSSTPKQLIDIMNEDIAQWAPVVRDTKMTE